jgi:hypothetical protein
VLALAGCTDDGHAPLPPGAAGATSGSSQGTGGATGNGAAGVAGSAGSSSSLAGAAGSAGAAGAPADFRPDCIPREGCQQLCRALGTDPAGCGLGDGDECECICEQRFNGPCPDELDGLLACTGEDISVDCPARGRIFRGCESESVALELCDFRAREQLCAQAFPACTAYCVPLTLSFCTRGPESVTSCLCGCEATLESLCSAQFDAFMSCSNQAPAFSCSDGLPAPSQCLPEWRALQTCAGVTVSSTPDAG